MHSLHDLYHSKKKEINPDYNISLVADLQGEFYLLLDIISSGDRTI